MKYSVQWSYVISRNGNHVSKNYDTMSRAEANAKYDGCLAFLRAEKEAGTILSFEICTIVCTKLVQE